MNAVLKFQLTHFGIWLACMAGVVGLRFFAARFLPETLANAVVWVASGAMVLYFVCLIVAPFGLGPFGQTLTNAAKSEERARSKN